MVTAAGGGGGGPSAAAAAVAASSRVWLNGARCSPARLPFAIAFTARHLCRMAAR